MGGPSQLILDDQELNAVSESKRDFVRPLKLALSKANRLYIFENDASELYIECDISHGENDEVLIPIKY